MRRAGLLAIALLGAVALVAACTTPVKIRNAAPRVNHIGAATPTDAGLTVTFWLQDNEEDPCDVFVAYAVGSAACDALASLLADPDGDPRLADGEMGLRSAVMGTDGHGTSGLTADRAFPGRVHVFAWDTSDVDAASEVCLYILPDDRNGNAGVPALSPTFVLAEGFADPAPPVADPDATGAPDATAAPDAGTPDAAVGD